MSAISSSAQKPVKRNVKQYKGAWFSAEYPSSFKVRPSMRSLSDSEGYDSACFESPDGTVEFYVFSPWPPVEYDISVPADIVLNFSSEKIVSETTDKAGDRTIKSYTIKANDGSYSRSYQMSMDNMNDPPAVFLVVGIKYKDKASYDKYKKQYIAFKKSIVQYAD